jgi:serine/threonine protein kinase
LEISHNLIVKCFGCFHDTDSLYIVEEFLPGETMREFTARRTEPLNEQEVGPKVCEILTALTYLSSLQLSYGNLTQDNILHALVNIAPRRISAS